MNMLELLGLLFSFHPPPVVPPVAQSQILRITLTLTARPVNFRRDNTPTTFQQPVSTALKPSTRKYGCSYKPSSPSHRTKANLLPQSSASALTKNQPQNTPDDGLCFEAVTRATIFDNADLQESRHIQVKISWRRPVSDEYQGIQFPYNYLRTFCDGFLRQHDRHYGFHPLERPDPDNINIVIPGRVNLEREAVALVLGSLRDTFAELLRNPHADVEFRPFQTTIANNLAVHTALKVLKIAPLVQPWEIFIEQALRYGPLDSVQDLKRAHDLFATNEQLVQGMLENFAYRRIHNEPVAADYMWDRPQDELILGVRIAKAQEKVRGISESGSRGHKKWMEAYRQGVRQYESWMETNVQRDFEGAKMRALKGSFVALF